MAALANHRPFFSETLSERLVRSFLARDAKEIPGRLTPRERTIVQLIAEGLTNQVIAKQLQVSVKTIESHRSSALAKIGATSTAAIVRYAIRNKLVEP